MGVHGGGTGTHNLTVCVSYVLQYNVLQYNVFKASCLSQTMWSTTYKEFPSGCSIALDSTHAKILTHVKTGRNGNQETFGRGQTKFHSSQNAIWQLHKSDSYTNMNMKYFSRSWRAHKCEQKVQICVLCRGNLKVVPSFNKYCRKPCSIYEWQCATLLYTPVYKHTAIHTCTSKIWEDPQEGVWEKGALSNDRSSWQLHRGGYVLLCTLMYSS